MKRLAILLFDEIEVLDFCGPFEVFSVSNRFIDATTDCESQGFELVTVAEAPTIRACGGLSVNVDATLENAANIDILLVPGGIGTRPLLQNQPVLDWIKTTADTAELVLSVCTGALLLAQIGLLNDLDATTHHVGFELLQEIEPTCKVRRDQRFVDNGRIVTSAGISAGIDMSLHIVRRLHGIDVAEKTAAQMEYTRG